MSINPEELEPDADDRDRADQATEASKDDEDVPEFLPDEERPVPIDDEVE